MVVQSAELSNSENILYIGIENIYMQDQIPGVLSVFALPWLACCERKSLIQISPFVSWYLGVDSQTCNSFYPFIGVVCKLCKRSLFIYWHGRICSYSSTNLWLPNHRSPLQFNSWTIIYHTMLKIQCQYDWLSYLLKLWKQTLANCVAYVFFRVTIVVQKMLDHCKEVSC